MEHERSQAFSRQNDLSQRNNSRHQSHQLHSWRVHLSDTHQSQIQRNWRDRGSESSPANSNLPRPNVNSKFTYKIDPDALLLDRKVKGFRVLTDYEQVRNIQKRIAKYTHGGSPDYYSAMSSIDISREHFKQMETTPYFVAPKPAGYRCLLYVNDIGEIFLQSRSVHIFQLDPKYASDFFGSRNYITSDTLIDTMLRSIDSVTDYQASSKTTDDESSDSIAKTRTKRVHAFYIMDAMRINGQDLTHLSVDQRISFAKENIMKPMWGASKPKKVSEQQEKFGLYIVDYVKLDQAEVLLSPEFQDTLDYPLQLLHFVPENQTYKGFTCPKVLLWHGEHPSNPTFYFRLRIPEHSTGEQNSKEGDLLALVRGNVETPYAKIAIITDKIRQLNGRVIRCVYEEGQWKFCSPSIRCYPNSHKTIESKFESAKHPVTMEDFRSLFSKLARQGPT